jgi:hypothetical protein
MRTVRERKWIYLLGRYVRGGDGERERDSELYVASGRVGMCVAGGGGNVGERAGELLKDAVCDKWFVSAPLWYVTCRPLGMAICGA